jgi:hypothetical protein
MTELEKLKKELEAARAENDRLKASGFKLSVSKQGGVMVLGMRKFPITFYKSEWIKILANADKIKAFIQANESQLKGHEQAVG